MLLDDASTFCLKIFGLIGLRAYKSFPFHSDRRKSQVRTPKPRQPRAKKVEAPITYEDKKYLRECIERLPEEGILDVFEIVKKSLPVGHSDDEIEIDIETLEDCTIRELQQYLGTYQAPGNKRKSGQVCLCIYVVTYA